jgi:2-polyprenyl-3-methyl-5-hydroxy-6-metoxy-1,4-benzoquinol methylase
MATDPFQMLFESMSGYQRTAALRAAVELDLFTRIAEGAATAPELAQRCGAAERGVRILCDTLAAHGFLKKDGGRYALDPELAPALDGRSPGCIVRAVGFMASAPLWQSFGNVAAAVRKGGTVLGTENATAAENPIWVEFARSMAPLARLSSQLLASMLDAGAGKPWKVLDVAAGHGLFGIAIAAANPKARVTALDWPNVLAVAEEHAREAGVADRIRMLPGDAFAVDWGTGYDLVLLTNILHHFDEPGCEALLATAHRALAPGGRAVLLEFVPDESRVSPPLAATFALVMLAMTPGGDAYTFAEYERMCRKAGFGKTELMAMPPPSPQQVVVAER